MLHKIFDNDLVAIRKSKGTLTLNKLAYVGIYIYIKYELYYDHMKNIYMVTTQGYYPLKLIVWCMKLKPQMFMNVLVRIEKCLICN